MTAKAKPLHRRLYDGWMVIAARFAFVQTLVMLAIFYPLRILTLRKASMPNFWLKCNKPGLRPS